jgi:DNA-binding transcriptional ArsR family regulator
VDVLDSECAQKLKVLSDPTRLTVLELLLEGPLHVGEIGERLGIEQSLLSHHLKVLRKAGMVDAKRDGKAVLYSLAPDLSPSGGAGINLGCCELSFNRP